MINARYKGDAQAFTDLVSGQIQMMFSTGTLTPNFVKDGKVKALVTLFEPPRVSWRPVGVSQTVMVC